MLAIIAAAALAACQTVPEFMQSTSSSAAPATSAQAVSTAAPSSFTQPPDQHGRDGLQ
jgi:hypothetical protein